MLIYRSADGWLLETDGRRAPVKDPSLTTREDLYEYLAEVTSPVSAESARILAPIEQQEVWAAGVTYYRSRTARMAESEASGAMSFYDRVYQAERPELFFKSTPHRVAGPGEAVRMRRDSKWNVPEPELAAARFAPRQNYRLYHRQRYEFARYRGRKSAVSSTG